MTHRSFARTFLPPAVAAIAFATGALGCMVAVSDDHRERMMGGGGSSGGGGSAGGGGISCQAAPPSAPKSMVDTGETLAATPGQGVGVFLEYAKGGRWHAWATCDTAASKQPCAFDLLVQSTSGPLGSAASDALEASEDKVTQPCSDMLNLVTRTTTDVDGMWFAANAGVAVQFDLLLDNAPAPEFLYWIDRGVIHKGAPANPVEIKPSAP